MTGYLDTSFEGAFGVQRGSSSLRRQLQSLLSAPNASSIAVYGFGEDVVSVQANSNTAVIGTLVRQEFYRDNDTRLEDVLDSVAVDTRRQAVHLIITDGRRATGAAAIAQYERIGQLARQWVADTSAGTGGVFAVAVLSAPFRPVRSDRAGCWDPRAPREEAEHEAEGEEDERAPLRCPLYTFAFIPRRSAGPVLERLRETATHLYVSPTVAAALPLDAATGASPGAALNVRGGKGSGQALHLYFTSTSPNPVRSTVTLAGDLRESAARFAMDDDLGVRVQSAQIRPQPGGEWSPVADFGRSWVKPGALQLDTTGGRIVLPLELRARADVPPTRYRVEIVSGGRPAWLRAFEAGKQGESTRTFGLSALFDQLPTRATPLARLYVSIY